MHLAEAMKKNLLSVFFGIFLLNLLPAQDCTLPDTSKMRQHKVKTVNVYFEGNGTQKSLHHTYEYNTRGQLILEKEANAGYWTEYKYDAKNRVSEILKITAASGIFNKTTISFPEGKDWREVGYYENMGGEKMELRMVYRYDSLDRMIYQAWYQKGEISHAQYLFPRNDKGPVDARDSAVQTREVFWRVKGRMVKLVKYDADWKNPVTTVYVYDEKDGALISEEVETAGVKKIFVPKYDEMGEISEVTCNGKALNATEKKSWVQAHYVFPRPHHVWDESDENPLPYSDPIPERNEKRSPVYNGKGLLSEETITADWNGGGAVKFMYEYSYY